ncbi:MAG: hypothetical protein DLM72_14060 [Candidatus Nitrosopolaris wilkensis]|nr:MAG: hypothetical protein DLM72_14060 [Candidatus Nitrosopolaris wilkensis]
MDSCRSDSIRNITKMPRASTIVFRNLMVALPIVLLLLVPVAQSIQLVNAQNSTMSGAGKTTITTTGNKTVISTSPSPNTTTGAGGAATAAPNYNRTGFTNLYVLTINGKPFPIKYSINGGKLIGILADKDRSTLVLVLNPSANGGNMTIELPRNVIDSKGASNADTKFLIKIDGKGVDYKEIANNVNARILAISFSKDNRLTEIIGTQMTS